MSNHHDLEELTTHCIRCGFCLESCPTFKITGAEHESPRGRIYLVRGALEGKLPWQEIQEPLDHCLGCRACETACPSGVEYGAILELARERLGSKPATKALLTGLTNPGLAKIQFTLGRMLPGKRMPAALSRLIAGSPAEADLPKPQPTIPWPELDESKLPPVTGQVALVLGCVMRVLYDPVHTATKRLLRRVGLETLEIAAPCCGALHAHAGMLDEARTRALQMAAAIPPEVPIVLNSAGCGSTMREYGFLDPSLKGVAARVRDLSEILLEHGLVEALQEAPGFGGKRITYHDACHLAHGQKVTQPPRELLKAIPGAEFVEIDEADTCCGSAGIYNVVQPQMARALLERKWGHISASGATLVSTGNPGCLAWIEQKSRETGQQIAVEHTAITLERAWTAVGRS